MMRGDFGWLGGEDAFLQCSWQRRPYLESVQITPSHPSDAALGAGIERLPSERLSGRWPPTCLAGQTSGLDASDRPGSVTPDS